MANQQSQIVTIDGVEFKVEDMTEQQTMLLNHVADIERMTELYCYRCYLDREVEAMIDYGYIDQLFVTGEAK